MDSPVAVNRADFSKSIFLKNSAHATAFRPSTSDAKWRLEPPIPGVMLFYNPIRSSCFSVGVFT